PGRVGEGELAPKLLLHQPPDEPQPKPPTGAQRAGPGARIAAGPRGRAGARSRAGARAPRGAGGRREPASCGWATLPFGGPKFGWVGFRRARVGGPRFRWVGFRRARVGGSGSRWLGFRRARVGGARFRGGGVRCGSLTCAQASRAVVADLEFDRAVVAAVEV